MKEKEEKFGSLTEKMIKFLNMKEDERISNYGKNGTSKMYERIRKNIDHSFLDAQIAFGYLPEKQRKKIDLINSYNELLEYVTKHKLAKDLPDVPVRTAINQLKAISENFEDNDLKKFAKPEFARFISLLQLIESRSPDNETWDPTSDKPKIHTLSTV